MPALYDLSDHDLCVRAESFYRDMECCVECKPHVFVRADEYDGEYGASGERDGTGTFHLEEGSKDVGDDRIRSKALY